MQRETSFYCQRQEPPFFFFSPQRQQSPQQRPFLEVAVRKAKTNIRTTPPPIRMSSRS